MLDGAYLGSKQALLLAAQLPVDECDDPLV